VSLPGQKSDLGGSVQVTAYGSAAHCKVESWYPYEGDLHAFVRCFAPGGEPADSRFTLTFDTRVPMGANSGGYAWGDQPYAASYTPMPDYQRGEKNGVLQTDSILQSASVESGRVSTGSYFVAYPKLKAGKSAALVTAYGSGPEYCKIIDWKSFTFFNITTTTINLHCYDMRGNLTDSHFVSASITDSPQVDR
jgi:hypothetical protein